MSQVNGGELSQALFRLSGVFQFGMREIDNSMAFVNISQSRAILGMEKGSAHEIAFNFRNSLDAANANHPSVVALRAEGIEAATWVDLQPQMSAMLGMVDYSLFIVGGILFLIAALGIINSMFMSIYERIYEFGVAMAIGTRPSQMILLIMTEAFFLALLSIVGGMLVSYLLIDYYSVAGISLGEMEFEGVNVSDNIKMIPAISQFTMIPLSVVALTLVSAIYPAIFTSKAVLGKSLQCKSHIAAK